MSNIAIKAENISKQYRLGQVGTGTLHQDLKRWWWEVRGKGDPFAKIGEVNDRAKKGNSDFVWALKDINFEIEQGSAVGIIGKNGAGKSTLLKILSKITSPTTGIIKSKGRIASLLEVGTGFHPELTGKENIFLNGAILGMSKREIRSKFDQIVDFSGVERYIDTPVKRYSSGMYVRLAFAVAAHLESEIMIVDEVLAVGDAEFQKKCLGKMNDVSKGEGRTVLFVSHNMAAVRTLCKRGIVLKDGFVDFSGKVDESVDYYLKMNTNNVGASYVNMKPKATDIKRIEVLDASYTERNIFSFSDKIFIRFDISVEKKYLSKLCLGIKVKDQLERVVFNSNIDLNSIIDKEGNHELLFTIPDSILMPNQYFPIVGLHIPNQEMVCYMDSPVQFVIDETNTDSFQYSGTNNGCVAVNCEWRKI